MVHHVDKVHDEIIAIIMKLNLIELNRNIIISIYFRLFELYFRLDDASVGPKLVPQPPE